MEDAVIDFAGELAYGKELQIDRAAMAIIMADVGDSRADNCLYAELFIQLARESLLGTLSRFDLASRKLPLEGHGLVWAALPNQHLAFAQD
jgi:hypothetical protein